MHQVEGANPSALTISSLWCSSANTPASHAGDRRSEAGQGRQLSIALKALSAMRSLGKRIQPDATPGEGSAVEPALTWVS